ncbi:MAG: hypothetical protein WCX79_00285 [Candidatus Paceibacterota bacterium]|jgi:hypothetical protein
MKTRHGFISNSSSSSFIISKQFLNELQIDAIKNHETNLYFKRSGCDKYDVWNIHEDELFVYGFTSMDNFDMREFLSMIGIDDNIVKWDD